MRLSLYEMIRRLRVDMLDDDMGDVGTPNLWETDDGACLWSNAQITRALDAAQREYARRVRLRVGFGVYSYPLGVDERDICLHPEILAVEWVKFTSPEIPDGRILESRPHEHADDPITGTAEQPVHYWTLNEQETTLLTVYGSPQAAAEAGTIDLRARRMPYKALVWTNLTAAKGTYPEIDRNHHEHLLYWAAWRLYQLQDADVISGEQAREWRAQWDEAIGPPVSAEIQQWHRDYTAGQHPRARPFGLT